MKTFLARTADQWREWITEHHDSESEVWLIFHKLHTGMASIAYKDALDEALCFGWVDSLVKRLDDRRYARKFTPRRADSRWSTTNRKRYAPLKASGVEAGWDQSSPDRPQLWSATTTLQNALEASTVHIDSVEEASGGVAVLRNGCALTPPTVCRLD